MGLLNLLNDDLTTFKYYTSKGYSGNGDAPGMKSLKFGSDRPSGGSSEQPYIQTPIPDNLLVSSPDFLLRNGSQNAASSETDVIRLSKYFNDPTSTAGLLFTIKQNVLSRVAVRTQASIGPLNDKIYLPTSTIAQAAGVSLGLHLNKQGLLGGFLGDLGLGNTYISKQASLSRQGSDANRLVELTEVKIEGKTVRTNRANSISRQSQELIEYRGGPGSALGFGKTNINFAKGSPAVPSQIGPLRTGNNNAVVKLLTPKGVVTGKNQNQIQDYTPLLGVTYRYDMNATFQTGIVANTLRTSKVRPNTRELNPEFDPQLYIEKPGEGTAVGERGPEIKRDVLIQSTKRPLPNLDYLSVASFDIDRTISGKVSSATGQYYISTIASNYDSDKNGAILKSYPDTPSGTVGLKYDGTLYKKSNDGKLILKKDDKGPDADQETIILSAYGRFSHLTQNFNSVAGFDQNLNISGEPASVSAKYILSTKESGYTGDSKVADSYTTGIDPETLIPAYDGTIYAKSYARSISGDILLNPDDTGPKLAVTESKYYKGYAKQISDNHSLSFKTRYGGVSTEVKLADFYDWGYYVGNNTGSLVPDQGLQVGAVGPPTRLFKSKSNKEVLKRTQDDDKVVPALGLSKKYAEGYWDTVNLSGSSMTGIDNIPDSDLKTSPSNTRTNGDGIAIEPNQGSGVYTLSNGGIQAIELPYSKGGALQDFRKLLRATYTDPASMALTAAPEYITANSVEGRINHGDPGAKKLLSSYVSGALDLSGKSKGPLDQINALAIYKSTDVSSEMSVVNDLVKFRIAAIDSNTPSVEEYLHFRAFIDNFSDSYTATWNPINYVGRGESFYSYGGFGRTISMGWTVAAQSKQELIAMYKKLNFLASNLAPDYSNYGYMRGPLVRITVGGYLYEQVGFITGMTLEIPQESTWEIGINDTGGDSYTALSDNTVKELPHVIKVSGFSFTPIHDFVPRKQKNTYDQTNKKVEAYGKQRYIALKARTTNWDYPAEDFTIGEIKNYDSGDIQLFTQQKQQDQLRQDPELILEPLQPRYIQLSQQENNRPLPTLPIPPPPPPQPIGPLPLPPDFFDDPPG